MEADRLKYQRDMKDTIAEMQAKHEAEMKSFRENLLAEVRTLQEETANKIKGLATEAKVEESFKAVEKSVQDGLKPLLEAQARKAQKEAERKERKRQWQSDPCNQDDGSKKGEDRRDGDREDRKSTRLNSSHAQ